MTTKGDFTLSQDVLIDAQAWIRVRGTDYVDDMWVVVITTLDHEGAELDRTLWSPPVPDVRALGAAVRNSVLYAIGGTNDNELKSEVLLAAFEI